MANSKTEERDGAVLQDEENDFIRLTMDVV